MQLMLIIWITINIIIIFLSQPRQRNKINDQPNKIRKGIIYTEKSILVKVQDSLIMGSFYLAIGVIIYVIFVNFSDETMQNAINWFKKVFIVTFFPIIITWITNNKEKPLRYLDIVVLGVIFSLVFHFVKIEDLKVIQQYKMFISLILSIFFVSFIILT